MFSTESIDTYNKFKLHEGNLYMNNTRVGIEEFHSGKNIEISNHLLGLTDNVDISGNVRIDGQLTVDQDVFISGTLYPAKLDVDGLEFSLSKPSTILYLTSTDISTTSLNADDNNLSIRATDLSINAANNLSVTVDNSYTMDANGVSISAESIYFNNDTYIIRNHSETISDELVYGEFLIVENLKITGRIMLPDNVSEGTSISGDFNVKGGTFSSANSATLTGTNTFTGSNILTGSTTIDYVEVDNGILTDISITRLSVTSDCDIFIENDNVFRIRNGNDLNVINVYDWTPDISNNLYYDKGNVSIGYSATYDASLNVFGPVDITGNVDITGSAEISESLTVPITYNTSDIRLKTDICDMDHGLDVIRQIKPKLYNKKVGQSSIKEAGVIAQDIMEIDELNYLVNEHPKTHMYSMNYNSLHKYSLLGIQELDKKIETLTERLDQRMAVIDQKLNIIYKRLR